MVSVPSEFGVFLMPYKAEFDVKGGRKLDVFVACFVLSNIASKGNLIDINRYMWAHIAIT